MGRRVSRRVTDGGGEPLDQRMGARGVVECFEMMKLKKWNEE
jgi:hypothetical protein